MKSKDRKSQELQELKAKTPDSKMTVFTSFSRAGEKGLSVFQMTELRRMLKELGAEYVVIKKTLIDRAMKGYDGLDIFGMNGSVGLVVGGEDPLLISKRLYEFSRKNQALQFFGALVTDSGFIGIDKFVEMAKMPTRDQLMARLFGMMKYPITGLTIVLGEVAKKKEVTI